MNDTVTITLREAEQRYGYSVRTLRAEAGRGRLTVYRIGKRLYTKPVHISEMVEKCRVEPKVRASGLIEDGDNGLSRMERLSSARGALSAMLKGQRSS